LCFKLKVQVFLTRNPNETCANLYNYVTWKANNYVTWKANDDMQFVLDPYACAMYIV
jgi:hypothetical protein